MLKKEEVYVRVSSEKKARKLKEVLDMFGEYHFSKKYNVDFNQSVGFVIHYSSGVFARCLEGDISEKKKKVSLKELRNILAMEYLKEGDVVVIKSIYNDEWVMEVDLVEDDRAYHKSAINKSSGYRDSKGFLELNFIRYATEEEKQLLKPQESVIDKAISQLHDVIQGLEELKGK